MRYFDHDTTASSDDALLALRIEHGGAAVDAYWTLLEKIYRDEKPLNLFGSDVETNAETKSVSHRLCVGSETLKTYVLSMLQLGLFSGTLESFTSERAEQNIADYREKCETARKNGKRGGRKPTRKPKANQGGLQSETNPQPSGLQEKKRKGIGLDKLNQYQYETGAAAIEEPHACPVCDAPMVRTNARKPGTDEVLYRCDLCGEEAYA